MKYPFNYMRSSRQRYALCEAELAHLMNQRSVAAISQYETGDRVPTLEGALALQVIFGLSPRDMFPGYFEAIEDAVMRRARFFHSQLEEKTDRRSLAKRELLEAMAARGEDSADGV